MPPELVEVSLPIAEEFDSIQGEGTWVGTPMRFIRLAGCPVGRPAKVAKIPGPLPVLPTGAPAVACASWDGRGFYCDTDFNRHYKKTVPELLEDVWQEHICLTGGEPLMHGEKLCDLLLGAQFNGIQLHIETSGTIKFGEHDPDHFWITVAPKVNCLDDNVRLADELRLLVDEHFHPDKLTNAMRGHHNVFLCPINGIDVVWQQNVKLCMEWLKEFPFWRMSCQVHKFLGLQ